MALFLWAQEEDETLSAGRQTWERARNGHATLRPSLSSEPSPLWWGAKGERGGGSATGWEVSPRNTRPREELSTGNVVSILAFFCPAAQNGAWKTLGIESSGKNTFTLAKEPRSSLLSRFTFSRNSPFRHHVLEFLVIVFIPRNWKSRALSF